MKTNSMQKRKGYLAVGGLGLVISIGYLGMSVQLPFGSVAQPGAGVFPIIVGVVLMLTSLAAMWEGWQMDKAEQVAVPVGADRKRLLSLIGLLLVYFVALPWLGQIISSALFCLFLMRLLSDTSWSRIIVYSLVIAVALHFVFVHLLQVPMPRGVLDF
jgi:putative tricarboxylic transport membrane protein